MLDQFIINGIGSLDIYDASVAERKIVDGAKKSIKETVPFSNKVYDFSKIDGELYWEPTSLEYVLEITADNPIDLERKVSRFKGWVKNIVEGELHDPFINDYHFIATFETVSVDSTEIEKAIVTVSFSAYPYMIANLPKVYSVSLTANKEKEVVIQNDSSHRIVPTISSNVAISLTIGSLTYNVTSGEITDPYFKIEAGRTVLKLKSTQNGTVSITFYEEVF